MKARKKAFELLKLIYIDRQYSNLLLRSELKNESELDKAFITQLVYGTLQNYRYVRAIWSQYVIDTLEEEISILLDMTFYQLLCLDKVPAYACINEAVEISKGIAHQKYTRLVNAVCRKHLKEMKTEVVKKDTLETLGIAFSHPTWLVQLWNSHYGIDVTEALLAHNLKKAEMSARVNLIRSSREDILQNPLFFPSDVSLDGVYCQENILYTEEYKSHKLVIQDVASQLVARFLNPKPNDIVLDICSAPGTKTSHLAGIMQNKGKIIACDIHGHRLDLVKKAMIDLQVSIVETKEIDGRESHLHFDLDYFDCILVDAPCSGLGTIRHKPDIKMRIQPDDLDEIAKTQKEILHSVKNLLKVDGTLVYSTCTLNKKENERQIASFLKENENFTLIEEKTIFGYEIESTDGFYLAKIQRIA